MSNPLCSCVIAVKGGVGARGAALTRGLRFKV